MKTLSLDAVITIPNEDCYLDALIQKDQTSACVLDAHIIVPQSEIALDALISGSQSGTLSMDAILYGPSEVVLDAILVSQNTDQKSVSVQTRSTTFKTAIFDQEA